MAEQKLPKLTTRVRFPSPAPASSESTIRRNAARGLGSIPNSPQGGVMLSSRNPNPPSSGSGPLALIGSFALGAAVMYLLDPENGNRRRALVRDKCTAATNALYGATEAAVSNAANRTRGLIKRTQQRIATEEQVDDAVLEA